MPNQTDQNELPSGFQLQKTLSGHNGLISRVVWSPDGNKLASSSFDGTIKLWNVDTGECFQTLLGHTERVREVSWSPNGQFIASGSDDKTIRIWEVATGRLQDRIPMMGVYFAITWFPDSQTLVAGGMRDDWSILFLSIPDKKHLIPEGLEGHSGQINTLALSSTLLLASGSHDSTIRLWEKETNKLVAKSRGILKGHSSDVFSVTWSPDGQFLASGSYDRTIRIWNPQTGRTEFILEGHTGSVNCVKFSYDGKLLASKSSDGTVRLWRCDTWKSITVLDEPTFKSLPFGLAFHPNAPVLATLGEQDTIIRIWKIDQDVLLNCTPINSYAQYTNAKVVLLGDSGVGKSGLRLVLTGQPFRATESTHGRHVHRFDSQEVKLENSRKEMREVLLWDLAGQPNYRLIHQLHLNELAVALIVFDARSETEPFPGVHYWNRALRQAQNLPGNSKIPLKKFLVSARTDRGRVSASRSRINSLITNLGFDDYFETSAKEGWDIPELTMAIREAIDWDTLPKVISTELFEKIKRFLIQEKQEKRLLSTVDDLYRTFVQPARQVTDETKELREQFDTCIGLLESRDLLIRRLSFGNLILMQPELLDAYASAIVNAAKDEPEGLGSIVEEDILAGQFRMPQDERIPDKEQEKLLLIATVKELLSREIALRVHTDDVSWLVFPSQLTREWPEAPDPEGKAVVFKFEGPILNVYTTLVVRLSQSGFFHRKDMWKDAVLFTVKLGGECGIWLRQMGEGKAELTIFFKPEASEETRFHFEEYVHTHLKRRALPESINRRRIFICDHCGTPVTDLQASRRRERGFSWINCGVCENPVFLLDREERVKANHTSIIPQIDKTADIQCQVEAAVCTIQGKIETKEFDVFLAHNSHDTTQVEVIAKLLKERGLNPWLGIEKIPPGKWFQDIIQQAIPNVKSAAIFIGTKGLGKREKVELRAFISQCLAKNIPVIPVLLPGVKEMPQEIIFLQELSDISFVENINESHILDKLARKIKNKDIDKIVYSQIKMSLDNFDVFLAHNSLDKPQVELIHAQLKQRGLKPWLDKEQIPPGRWFQDVIQKAIPNVKSAAIFIGVKGLGKWQAVELRSFISRCVEEDIPVIPVLLPGVDNIPEYLLFLQGLNWVRFFEEIDEVDGLNNLIWGITGKKP